MTKTKFGRRSYMKATPKNLRKLGDALLGVTAVITGSAIAQDADILAYVSLGFGILGKFLTDFFSED